MWDLNEGVGWVALDERGIKRDARGKFSFLLFEKACSLIKENTYLDIFFFSCSEISCK